MSAKPKPTPLKPLATVEHGRDLVLHGRKGVNGEMSIPNPSPDAEFLADMINQCHALALDGLDQQNERLRGQFAVARDALRRVSDKLEQDAKSGSYDPPWIFTAQAAEYLRDVLSRLDADEEFVPKKLLVESEHLHKLRDEEDEYQRGFKAGLAAQPKYLGNRSIEAMREVVAEARSLTMEVTDGAWLDRRQRLVDALERLNREGEPMPRRAHLVGCLCPSCLRERSPDTATTEPQPAVPEPSFAETDAECTCDRAQGAPEYHTRTRHGSGCVREAELRVRERDAARNAERYHDRETCSCEHCEDFRLYEGIEPRRGVSSD